jgi:hypothetical protein
MLINASSPMLLFKELSKAEEEPTEPTVESHLTSPQTAISNSLLLRRPRLSRKLRRTRRLSDSQRNKLPDKDLLLVSEYAGMVRSLRGWTECDYLLFIFKEAALQFYYLLCSSISQIKNNNNSIHLHISFLYIL